MTSNQIPVIDRGKAMFCGIVHTPHKFKCGKFFKKNPGFHPRKFDGDTPGRIECGRDHLETLFTPEFINAIYPAADHELKHDRDIYARIRSWRKRIDRRIDLYRPVTDRLPAPQMQPVLVEYIDCCFFPNDIMAYVVTVNLNGMPLDQFMYAAGDIRLVNYYDSLPAAFSETRYRLADDEAARKRELKKRNYAISEDFLALFDTAVRIASTGHRKGPLRLSHDVFEGNRLYQYTALRIPSAACDAAYDSRHLLIDLTMGLRYGSSQISDANPNRVAEGFIDEAFNAGGLKMYENWSALTCADSFVAVADHSCPDWAFDQWDFQRFLIYLNTLLCKAMLIKINSDAHQRDINTSFEASFLQFDRVVNPPIVSYNALPQALADSMRQAMGVTRQSELIQHIISRNAEKKRDRMEQGQNYILFTLAILGVFEAVNAFNTLVDRPQFGWPMFTILGLLVIILIIGITKWIDYKRM